MKSYLPTKPSPSIHINNSLRVQQDGMFCMTIVVRESCTAFAKWQRFERFFRRLRCPPWCPCRSWPSSCATPIAGILCPRSAGSDRHASSESELVSLGGSSGKWMNVCLIGALISED
eukprot:TRINITY_DN19373_c0_g1_i1.p2 TRINITY_DN19373_c0_g1~~TRINITY_DN19373_c0_g1_i1.p2  ORF type:complete len:117 (+),score=8.13 TRINITY_DN19373_c0_g1_i1:456-806(+)